MQATLVYRDVRPASGGLAVDVRDIANGLAERGHQMRVLTISPGPKEPWFHPEVTQKALAPWSSSDLAGSLGLASGTRQTLGQGKRIVHVYSCLPVYLHFAAMVTAKQRRCPLVWTPMLAPGRHATWANRGRVWRVMEGFDRMVPRAARWTDAVVASTTPEAEAFRRWGARRVVVIPPAVAAREPASQAEAERLRREIGAGGDPIVLMVAARAEPRKGMEFGFRAVARLRERLPAARLVVVGSATTGGDRADVIALGRVSETELAVAYRAADVVFVPSQYEAFSRVVIEAWQQGTPVLTSDGVPLGRLAVEERAGWMVPFGDVDGAATYLLRALGDSERAQEAGDRGRALVHKRFLVSQAVQDMERLYAGLLEAALAERH